MLFSVVAGTSWKTYTLTPYSFYEIFHLFTTKTIYYKLIFLIYCKLIVLFNIHSTYINIRFFSAEVVQQACSTKTDTVFKNEEKTMSHDVYVIIEHLQFDESGRWSNW